MGMVSTRKPGFLEANKCREAEPGKYVGAEFSYHFFLLGSTQARSEAQAPA